MKFVRRDREIRKRNITWHASISKAMECKSISKSRNRGFRRRHKTDMDVELDF